MIQSIKEMLSEWNAAYGERAKLQHAYLAVVAIGIVVAGLTGLLNDNAGQTLLRVSFTAAGVFVANAVVWALLSSMVLNRFPARKRTSK